MNQRLSADDWSKVCTQLNKHPHELLRQDSPIYQARLRGLELTDSEWLDVLVRYPELVQRPIVLADDWAVVPEEPQQLAPYLSAHRSGN